MIEKLEGARAEAKISGKAERTRVSTETKDKTEALDMRLFSHPTRYSDYH